MKKFFILVLLLISIFSLKNLILHADGYDSNNEEINVLKQNYIIKYYESYCSNSEEKGILKKLIIFEQLPNEDNNSFDIEEDKINNYQDGTNISIEDHYEEYKLFPLKMLELFEKFQPKKRRPRPIMPIIREIQTSLIIQNNAE